MIYLTIDKSFLAKIKPELLERTAWATFQHQGISPDASVSIVVTDDTQLHQLNLQFVGIDEPTDVLSFPAGYTDPDSQSLYLGDILISYPRALAQAEKADCPVESELQLLVVHGILHLAGHDHADSQEKNHMWAAQREILTLLGISNINLPE
jgi:probable rRNA maturation factor